MPSRSEIDKRRKKASASTKKVRRKKAKKPVAKKKAKKPAAKKKSKKPVAKKKSKKPVAKNLSAKSQTKWLSVAVEEGSEIQTAKFIGRVKCVIQVLLPIHDGAALYPGYVFSECDLDDDVLLEICHLADVEGILSQDGICNYATGGHGDPAELDPEALRSIRESEARYAKIMRSEMTNVEKGQKITITSGVFSGMSGHVISVNRRKMSVIAKVRLSDGGMVRKVSVKYGQFDVAEGERDDDWRL